MNDRFFLYPNKVLELRKKQDLSHAQIAIHRSHSVSKRTMSAIENGRYDSRRGVLGNIVSMTTAENLAKVLNVEKEELGYRVADASHTYVPSDSSIENHDKQSWSDGNIADMDGDHQAAITQFATLYEKRGNYNMDVQAALANAYIQAFDHLAQQASTRNPQQYWNRALRIIDEVKKLTLSPDTPSIAWVTQYQAAIIHIQLAGTLPHKEAATHIKMARKLLTALKEHAHRSLKTSAEHQLARLDLEDVITASDVGDVGDNSILDDLERRFQECRKAWEQDGARHRTGYADLSLSRLYAFKNDFENALRCLLSAMREFATFNCHRYVAMTEAELSKLLAQVNITAN